MVEESISNLSHDELKKAYLNLKLRFNALVTENSNLQADLDKLGDAKNLSDSKVVEFEMKTGELRDEEERGKDSSDNLLVIFASLLCFSFCIIVMILFMICIKNKKTAQGIAIEGRVSDRRWTQKDVTSEFMPKITEI